MQLYENKKCSKVLFVRLVFINIVTNKYKWIEMFSKIDY